LTDRFVRLAEENVDVAVGIGPKPGLLVPMRKLGQIRWQTVASPAYLARRGTPSDPSQLSDHDCLRFVLPHGVLQPWYFREPKPESQDAVLNLRSRLRSDHGETLIDAAIAGQGIFQAHHYAVADAIERGELVAVLSGFEARGPDICLLLAPGRRRSPKVRAFAELVTQLCLPSNDR
jgi:LysR family transcriptional regulator for bpeEF and oprC